MRSGGQFDARLADDGVDVPIAGGGNGERSGHVFAINVQMEGSTLGLAGDAEVEGVGSGGGDGDGVVEILSGLGIADEISAAVGGWDGADADAFQRAIQAAAVDVSRIVVAGSLAAEVEVLYLDGGEWSGLSAVWAGQDFAEGKTGGGLAGGNDGLAENGWRRGVIAGLGNNANRESAGGEAGDAVTAGGSGGRHWIAGIELSVSLQVGVDSPTRQSRLGGLFCAIAVIVVDDRPGDRRQHGRQEISVRLSLRIGSLA